MRSYLALLTHRDARWPLVTSMISRLTPGMMILALVLLLREHGYSYAAAGVVSAGHQLGVGLASPLQGRLVDRYGQVRILPPDAVLYLGGTLALTFAVGADALVPLLVLVALLTGAFYPPVTASSRVLLSRLFPTGRLRETAFALSSVSVELGFVVGPVVAVWVAEATSAEWSVVVAGMASAVGALGYAVTRAARATPRRVGRRPSGGALRSPGVRVIVLAVGMAAVAFGVLDITVPAVAELAGDRSDAGRLIATLAGGSLLSGIVYGARSWPGTLASRLRVVAIALTGGMLLLPLTVSVLPLFTVGLFVAGVFLAPTTICAFQLLDDLAIRGTQTEAQAWLQSSVVFGVAAGASLAGVAVDHGGPGVALLVGAVGVGLGAGILNLRARVLARPREDEPVTT
ncbi:MAG: MFS transporter [Nitriliruptoraceae bacterium]